MIPTHLITIDAFPLNTSGKIDRSAPPMPGHVPSTTEPTTPATLIEAMTVASPSASSGRYALITVHPRRGREAMNAAGVLPAFAGIAVHDAWAPYDSYGGVAGHALCNAHALRELQAVIDAAPPGQWCWAARPPMPSGT